MAARRSERQKAFLYSSVIVLNLSILSFVGYSFFQGFKAGRTAEAAEASLSWGDPSPLRGFADTIDGKRTALAADRPGVTLFLLFHDSASREHVEELVKNVGEILPGDDLVRLVGVFHGTAKAWHTGATEETPDYSVIADHDGSIRRAFRIDDSNSAFTIAIDDLEQVRLAYDAILDAESLLDYAERQMLGTVVSFDPPPSSAADHSAWSPADPLLEDTVRVGASDELEIPQVPDGTRRSLLARRVSIHGGGRLRADHDRDRLYTLSRRKNHLWVLSSRFEKLGRFGGFGQGPGEFIYPGDLAIDHDGSLYVADWGNKRIQKLSPEGDLLSQIESGYGVRSIALSRDGDLYVAAPLSGNRVLRFDASAQDSTELHPVVPFREIPWLRERVEKTFASESEANRKEYFRGYEAVLNDAYLVVDAADRLLALSVWEPDLRIYDEQGRMLRQLDFTWSDRDDWSTQFDQELAKAMAGRQRSVMLVFQDLAIDPDRDLLAIALTSDCPGLLFVDFAGRLVEELCLVDTEGGGIAAGSIHPLGEGRWLATNESGVYWFKMGDP